MNVKAAQWGKHRVGEKQRNVSIRFFCSGNVELQLFLQQEQLGVYTMVQHWLLYSARKKADGWRG